MEQLAELEEILILVREATEELKILGESIVSEAEIDEYLELEKVKNLNLEKQIEIERLKEDLYYLKRSVQVSIISVEHEDENIELEIINRLEEIESEIMEAEKIEI